jgi:hypothetical protein
MVEVLSAVLLATVSLAAVIAGRLVVTGLVTSAADQRVT